jgi:hypothetical protein
VLLMCGRKTNVLRSPYADDNCDSAPFKPSPSSRPFLLQPSWRAWRFRATIA